MNFKFQNIIAVVCGWLIIVLVSIAFYPLMKLVLANNISISAEKGVEVNNVAISIYKFLFIAIACFIGGYITCWISKVKKLLNTLLSSFLLFIILLLVSLFSKTFNIWGIFDTISVIPFMFMGGLIRRIIENKNID